MGYQVTVLNGTDEWTKFVTNESAGVVAPELQNRLLRLIDVELKDRETCVFPCTPFDI